MTERERSILIVEDDPASSALLRSTASEHYRDLRTACDGLEAVRAIETRRPDLVISDLRMPRLDGLALLRMVKQRWPELPFILITVVQDVSTVVEAMQLGAVNYLAKPISPGPMLDAIRCALRSRPREPVPVSSQNIVGTSAAMVRVRHLVALGANCDANVLITGETGTGKELVACAIHRLSCLSAGPFVPTNCAVVPADLFESEFFGHRRGAFTGAERDRVGLLRRSHGGILFLDELECLSVPHQSKLLRVLDDGEVRPVGSNDAERVSIRFLAATNVDPLTLLAAGSLREDLYYRLAGFQIRLPPLRERREDIEPLVAHFLGRSAVSRAALQALLAYPWPGNVRQLRNVLASAHAIAGAGTIEPEHLALDPSTALGTRRPDAAGPTLRALTLKESEQDTIERALRAAAGNRSRAARQLGIDRSTLRRKIRDLGIAD